LDSKQISIILAPAMANKKMSKKAVVFIQNLLTLTDFNKYFVKVIVDTRDIYFLFYDLRTDSIASCVWGYLENNYWYIEADKKKTWDKARVIEKLLKTNKSFNTEGRW
jgi:hypothetical protein